VPDIVQGSQLPVPQKHFLSAFGYAYGPVPGTAPGKGGDSMLPIGAVRSTLMLVALPDALSSKVRPRNKKPSKA